MFAKNKQIHSLAITKLDTMNKTYFDSENDFIKANDNKSEIEFILADSQKLIQNARTNLNLLST